MGNRSQEGGRISAGLYRACAAETDAPGGAVLTQDRMRQFSRDRLDEALKPERRGQWNGR